MLQTPAEQERLLLEIPEIIGEELEALPLDSPDNMEKGHSGSLIPIPKGSSEVPLCDVAVNATRLPLVSPRTGSAGASLTVRLLLTLFFLVYCMSMPAHGMCRNTCVHTFPDMSMVL